MAAAMLMLMVMVAVPGTGVAPDTAAVPIPDPGHSVSAVALASAVAPEPVDRFERLRPTVPDLLLPVAPVAPTAGIGPAASIGSIGDPANPQRPVLVDYSDGYYTRLTIHKWASWAMLPLFGLAYYTGQDLYNKGLDAPQWERNIHAPVAATLAGLFAVNTVTGGLNLWEGRKDPNGRTWRTAHGLLMLLADAGFAAVGLTAPENETHSGVYTPGSSLGESEGNPRLHRQLAISSMAVAVLSWAMMLPPFRRE